MILRDLFGKSKTAPTQEEREQAQECFERIVEQMKQSQGVTEQLKAEKCEREIVDKEMIYR